MSGDVHKYLDPSYALLLRIVAVDDVRSSADMLRCSCTRPCTSSVRRRLKTRVHAANLRHGGQATAADAAALASARAAVPRRDALALAAGLILLQQQCWGAPAPAQAADAAAVEVVSDAPGFGTHPAAAGDLVLVHYVGTIAGTDTVFDSTRGGLRYRDGGQGVLRPLALRLGGGPLPGVCAGLQQAILGMRVGGKRTVVVPPELGFGSAAVLAPYAVLPGGSAVQYEVELLRLSSKGPDAMMKGMAQCSAGGASAAADGCANIEPAEFV